MEPFVLFMLMAVGVLVFMFWHQRRAWKDIPKPDAGYTIATDGVERTFEATTDDIDQALNADDAEDQIADMINRRGGPL